MNQSHEESRKGYRIFLRTGAPLRNRVIDWSCDVPNYHFYGVKHKFFKLVSSHVLLQLQ